MLVVFLMYLDVFLMDFVYLTYLGDLIELGSFTCHHVNDPSSTFISDDSLWGGFSMYPDCFFNVF